MSGGGVNFNYRITADIEDMGIGISDKGIVNFYGTGLIVTGEYCALQIPHNHRDFPTVIEIFFKIPNDF